MRFPNATYNMNVMNLGNLCVIEIRGFFDNYIIGKSNMKCLLTVILNAVELLFVKKNSGYETIYSKIIIKFL